MSIENQTIELDPERIEQGANHVITSLNELVGMGYSNEEAFIVALYALGNAMCRHGVVVNVQKPIREQLIPFYDGYQTAKRRQVEKRQQAQASAAKH